MVNKIKGGSKETIEGFTCYKPPAPPKEEIQGNHLPKSKQKWYRTKLPTFKVSDIEWFSGDNYNLNKNDEITWEQAVREETLKVTGTDPWDTDIHGNPKKIAGVDADPNYFSEPVENFRYQELHRIFHGHWFMNNGKKVFLTGIYYFYLNWWMLEDGYPEFRDNDRKVFYLFEYVRNHPTILGILYITMRGVGKSYIAGCCNYYEAITHRKAVTGIQSKNDDDAEKLFKEQVLTPVTELPEFLVPIHRHSGDLTKSNNLNFSPPARKNMDYLAYRQIQKTALRSYMSFANSKEYAYDRATLKHLIQDEVGKTPPSIADVEDRLNVVLDCVWRGNKKTGWILATTTVEKMEQGGQQCKNIWYKSDIKDVNENGRPPSGIIRVFVSALDATHHDEYGYPEREKARKYHEAELEAKKNNPADYISYVQKHPFSIEQAFQYAGNQCIYNAQILKEREVFLSDPENDHLTIRGDFVFEEDFKRVKFVENRENGGWIVGYLFEDPRQANNIKISYGFNEELYISPKNNHKFAAGMDPVSHFKVQNKLRASKCACSVKMRDNSFYPELSNIIIAHYLYRSYDPEVDYKNILAGLIYYGCSVLIESNKSNAINYYYRVGAENFIMKRPGSTMPGKDEDEINADGIPSGTGTINHYVSSTKTHVQRYGSRELILPVVRDWLRFDPKNSQQYDSAVSASLAIVAEEKPVEDDEGPERNIEDLFATYDNSGSVSQMN